MKVTPIDPVAAFDIETVEWDRFFCGALYHGGRMRTFKRERERELVEAILAIGTGDVIAHNGGRFDFLWFLDCLFRFGLFREGMTIQVTESGASIVSMTIRGAGMRLTFRDTFKMFPVSLRTMGGKGDVGVKCRGESAECREHMRVQAAMGQPPEGCGGYCAIRFDMAPAEEQRVISYCAQDVRALWDGTRRLLGFADSLNLSMAGTTGATAWKTARAWGLIGPTPLSHRAWLWTREGYFGGRVGLFRPTAPRGWHYDITSSYPHQTTQPLPDGDPTYLAGARQASAALDVGKPGVYRARVTIPECEIPPLPWRAKLDGVRRNAYPVGTFVGTWALPDLEYAAALGASVEPIAAMVFPRTVDAFRPLMDHLIGARLHHGKATAEGKLLKLWANSLYGKFAQEPRTSRLVIARSSFDVPEGARAVNREGTAFLVPVKGVPSLPESSHVEKAAYITARGRVQLHQMLTARGDGDAIYCDTDSVFSLRARDASDGVRPGLGGWADEGEFADFAAIGPKLYRFDQLHADGKRTPVLRAKGIALPSMMDDLAAAREWTKIASGALVERRAGVQSVRTALRGGPLFVGKTSARATRGAVTFGDRIPDGEGSRPPRASELTPAALTYEWSPTR